ncbi:hypothetical protein QVD99_001990 [Batrachochytrium dendrobatidis]|nr:hypothetical protein O5D80_000632 [Batrachochytrium dendrobatidis]KAK5672187.1 hypothetical protein QVD99_001990 [Batrachochytrium dendrobatidis]
METILHWIQIWLRLLLFLNVNDYFFSIVRVNAFGTHCPLLQQPSTLTLANNQYDLRHPRFDFSNLVQNPTPMKSSKKDEAWEVKLAIMGDQGLGAHPKKVLKLVRDWGAHALIQLGDFDYEDDPSGFMEQFTDQLGKRFPMFAVIGNHDVDKWFSPKGYKALLTKQAEKSGIMRYCTGEYGVNMVCQFNGIVIVLSGVGTLGKDHAEFIDQALTEFKDSKWKLCVWHKNQNKYQTGDKKDETGYLVYDTCRKHGAIVLTSHEHSYARSHLMSNFETTSILSTSNTLHIRPGFSFVALSGLGGDSIRFWKDQLQNNPWWAATAAMDNGANYGALLCKFHHNGEKDKAKCHFEDIDGKVWDMFHIESSADEYVNTLETVSQSTSFVDTAIQDGTDFTSTNMSTGVTVCGNERLEMDSLMQTDQHVIPNRVHTLTFHIPLVPSDQKITHAHLQMKAAHPTEPFQQQFTSRSEFQKTYVDVTDIKMSIWRIQNKPVCNTNVGNPLENSMMALKQFLLDDDNLMTFKTVQIIGPEQLDHKLQKLQRPDYKSYIKWERGPKDENWEIGEVFVSPNLAHLITDAMSEYHQYIKEGFNGPPTVPVTLAIQGEWWFINGQVVMDQNQARSFYGVHPELGTCISPSLVVQTIKL